MKHSVLIYTAIIAIFWSGCETVKKSPASSGSDTGNAYRTTATVEVYKYDGSVQCYGGGTDLDTMASELTDNNIEVVSSYCDVDGYYHITLCGTNTGHINVYEIYADDLDAAIAIGFNSVDELPDFQDI